MTVELPDYKKHYRWAKDNRETNDLARGFCELAEAYNGSPMCMELLRMDAESIEAYWSEPLGSKLRKEMEG